MARHPCNSCYLIICLLSAAVAAGCVAPVDTTPVFLDTDGVRPSTDYADLATLLQDAMDEEGRVDADDLRRHEACLDRQLRRLAITGPRSTPDLLARQADLLAYWCNARAAWALKLALLADCPDELPPEALERRPFPLDGRRMTLEQIDAELARHGWRVVAAAPGIRYTRARIPRAPFAPEDVYERLAARLQEFLGASERFVIDEEARTLRVPRMIWEFREKLIADYERKHRTVDAMFVTALLSYTTGSAHRRLQDAIGYAAAPAAPGKLAWQTWP